MDLEFIADVLTFPFRSSLGGLPLGTLVLCFILGMAKAPKSVVAILIAFGVPGMAYLAAIGELPKHAPLKFDMEIFIVFLVTMLIYCAVTYLLAFASRVAADRVL